MQKRITTTLTVILLTLTLTQLAAAQWIDNEFTNNTSGDLYVSFTTFRPAADPIPQGWRTVGWYLIRPGRSHTFQGWADNPIYYLIWEADTEDYLTPANAKKFTFWEHLDSFVTVSGAEPNVPVAAGDLLYSSRNKGTLIETREFFKSGNGGSVTVNATGREGDGGTVSKPGTSRVVAPLAELAEVRPPDDIGVSITPDPISTTLEPGDDIPLTISLTGTDAPADVRLVVEVDPEEAATVSKVVGRTNNLGEFETILTVGSNYIGVFDVLVSATPGGSEIEKTFAFTSELIPSSLTIGGDFSISEGETGTVTATVLSRSGQPLSGVTVRFSESSEHISLSSSRGTTNTSGKVSTTVTAVSEGNAVLSVEVDGYPALNKNEALSVDEPPVGSLTVNSFSTSINEGDSRTITATVRARSGNPLSGKTVRFQENSSAISFSSTSGTTNSSGQVSTTLSAINISSRSQSSTFSVRVDGYAGLDKSFNVTVNQVARKLSVSPQILNDITSGNSRTITATVRSRGNYAMSGITVEFVESDYEIKFSRTRGVTNSNGQVTSTLRSGYYGPASFVVKAGGLSQRYNLTVSRFTKPFTIKRAAFSRKFECEGPWENWTIIANTPGDVVGTYHIRYEIPESDVCCMKYQGMRLDDSNTIRVWGRTRTHCRDQNEIYITLTGNYAAYASAPGAPSLHPQLQHQTGQLSTFWEDMSQVPSETALLPNYPNPFNPETWIPYHLSDPAEVTLSIYSAEGRLVRTLALGHQAAGIYESKSRAAYWDGRNSVGERVASGLYFYTLTAGDFAATGKMLIMK